MKTLGILVLACTLLGATMAAAETMSCFVDTRAYDEFTPEYCFAVIPGATSATAVFKALEQPLPNRFQVLWSNPRCDKSQPTCSVRIYVFRPYTMTATVLNYDTGQFYDISATAEFENGW